MPKYRVVWPLPGGGRTATILQAFTVQEFWEVRKLGGYIEVLCPTHDWVNADPAGQCVHCMDEVPCDLDIVAQRVWEGGRDV